MDKYTYIHTYIRTYRLVFFQVYSLYFYSCLKRVSLASVCLGGGVFSSKVLPWGAECSGRGSEILKQLWQRNATAPTGAWLSVGLWGCGLGWGGTSSHPSSHNGPLIVHMAVSHKEPRGNFQTRRLQSKGGRLSFTTLPI